MLEPRDVLGLGLRLAANLDASLRQYGVRMANCVPTGQTRQFGTVTVASTGLPVAGFNRVYLFEQPDDGDLSSAVEWMSTRGVPFWVTVPDRLVETVWKSAADLGLVLSEERQPGLVLTSLENLPPRTSDAEFTRVTDDEEMDAFMHAVASVWPVPLEEGKKFYSALLSDEHFSLFVGFVDGRPAACGILLEDGDTAGVYTIGVAEDFRRRGIGKAMTWEVLRVGRERGCLRGALQSTPMSHALYETMGFEMVVTYHQFAPAEQTSKTGNSVTPSADA